ncbi:hypothetical protein [Microbacterium sp. SS28]|uniref:hypothetical protein n=1 Tax=Microbacterium sp. SS28 TaxID=2919948 RepID=UPI001FAB0996|nr:hypothetical protein [Microbacterium sp. SS28]
MTTILTPPPAGTDAPPPRPPASNGSGRVVAVILIVFGGLVVLGTMVSALVSTIASGSVQTTTRTVDATGVTDLDVDLAAGSLRIEFGDVTDAELEVTGAGGAERWTLRNDDGDLVVSSPDGWFNGGGWPFGGWLFGDNRAGDGVLTLPQSLEGTDADITLAAGELVVDEGDFGDVELDMGAGRTRFEASVDSFSADVSAGAAELALDGAREASFSVSAGALDAVLTGAQPRTLDLQVSAGSLDITVPEGEYDVTSDVSAGNFDNRVGSTPGASSTVTVDVSAGKAILRAG